ncbi:MAG: hypothetical protein TR69_WS6001000052 [candidate division WS6 bacterium OLB20]|uniref:Uncharacterized protein n=1 Tax=candidate division WS6 bacterium OLB20 TaxID=1617426 RepID=A0A136M120_9BACT|nr:MAG: hypothetical protein TR69_WS6001000052 [candidate division WS6 bacterium OLB20]
MDEYVQKIKDENLEVVGLTNYFNFSDDDWGLKDKLEKVGIVVFLNLELRLTYTNKEDDCCDLHLVFSNELTKQDIDPFLTKLNCSVSGSHKMLSAATSIDEKKIAVVEFKDVTNTLGDDALSNLRGKVLVGMLSRGKGNSRSSIMYESLTKDSDFVIHSSNKVANISDDIKFWTGEDVEKPLTTKAIFQSSDAHSLDQIGKKFTWVKGDSCFETLRQAVVDYKNRVLIQDRAPSESKNSSPELFINKIEYNQDGETRTLYFNRDMNSVIGKRGAGKSVLLKHIAYDVLREQVQPDVKEIHKLKDFAIQWSDNSSENKYVEYIPQNYLSTITYEDGREYDKRDQLLRDRLFNNEIFKNADVSKSEMVNSIELKIHAKLKEALSMQKQIVDTTRQLKPLGKVIDKEEAIKLKQEEINKLGKVAISDEDIKNQTEYSSEIESLSKEIKLLEQDIRIIANINSREEMSFITVDDEAFSGLSHTTLELIEKQIEKLSNQEIKVYLNSLFAELMTETQAKKRKERHLRKES